MGDFTKIFESIDKRKSDIKHIFKNCKDNNFSNLWRHFDYLELNQIVRQSDPVICSLLNNVRIGNLSEENILNCLQS